MKKPRNYWIDLFWIFIFLIWVQLPCLVAQGVDDGIIEDLFDLYVEKRPSDQVGQKGEPDNTRKDIYQKLISHGDQAVIYLSHLLESDDEVERKKLALIVLRNSGLGTEVVLPIVRKNITAKQEDVPKVLLTFSVSYIAKHGERKDLDLLRRLAEKSDGSLRFYVSNAADLLESNIGLRKELGLIEAREESAEKNLKSKNETWSSKEMSREEGNEMSERVTKSSVWLFLVIAFVVTGFVLVLYLTRKRHQ